MIDLVGLRGSKMDGGEVADSLLSIMEGSANEIPGKHVAEKKTKLFRRERQAKQQHIIRAGNSGLLAAPAGYRPARIFPARLNIII